MKCFAKTLLLCLIGCVAFAAVEAQTASAAQDKIESKLGWMIGNWEAIGGQGPPLSFECKWVLDGQFMMGSVQMGQPSREILRVMMGWDPVEKTLTVDGFSARGDQSSGKYLKTAENEIHFAVDAVTEEGRLQLTVVYAHPNDDTLIVEYRDVTRDGQKQESAKVEYKRKQG
jgi:hypothetical protein